MFLAKIKLIESPLNPFEGDRRKCQINLVIFFLICNFAPDFHVRSIAQLV